MRNALVSVRFLAFQGITDHMSDPAWKSWLALVEFETTASRESIQLGELPELDKMQMAHHKAFFNVKEYEGCEKPKLLLRANYPVDIYHTGPLIRTWCMTFEAHLRILKAIARNSNYRNVEKRMASIYAVRCGLLLADMAQSKCTNVEATVDFTMTVEVSEDAMLVVDPQDAKLDSFQREVRHNTHVTQQYTLLNLSPYCRNAGTHSVIQLA